MANCMGKVEVPITILKAASAEMRHYLLDCCDLTDNYKTTLLPTDENYKLIKPVIVRDVDCVGITETEGAHRSEVNRTNYFGGRPDPDLSKLDVRTREFYRGMDPITRPHVERCRALYHMESPSYLGRCRPCYIMLDYQCQYCRSCLFENHGTVIDHKYSKCCVRNQYVGSLLEKSPNYHRQIYYKQSIPRGLQDATVIESEFKCA